jgi:DNA polymerase-3 subunit delta'
VPLAAPAARERSLGQTRLLETLRSFSSRPGDDLPEVFSLVREFLEVLSEARSAIAENHAGALKREEQQYKQTTDGKWLGEREDYYKALTEARYHEARARLLATLEQWWADVLRQKHGAAALDHPDFAEATARLAERWSTPELLRKSAALEELRDHLGRNIQEQLGIEVAFLKAFGS